MKTIYDLKIGDSYYVPLLSKYTETMENPMFWKPTKNKIRNEESLILFNGLVSGGKVFITEEDCQKSIDYEVALAKINKRASELYDDEIEQDYCYIDFIHESSNELWFFATHQLDDDEELQGYARRKTGYRLCFDKDICGHLIEELPEECKIVLGVE